MPTVEEKVSGETILMNPQRQLILQYLSKYPCNHMNGIVRDLGLSYPTVKWHIDLLVKQEFISYKNVGNKNVYFPYNMIADKDIELFTFLNKDKARALFLTLIKKAGLTQKEIARSLNISEATVSRYILDLLTENFIRRERHGKVWKCYANPFTDT